jgi:hypothetical protein
MTPLLTLLFIKHFLADFVFQTEWMVRGKGSESGWFTPLLAHAGVHQLFTTTILLFFIEPFVAISVGVVENWLHITIDRVKASPDLLGRYSRIDKPAFWNALGADQLAHALTYIAIAHYVL